MPLQHVNSQPEKISVLEYLPIAIIGCFGFNFHKRVLGELGDINPKLIVGYDLVGQRERPVPFRVVQVHDDELLAKRLKQQQPRVVLIETPDDCHAKHIRLALEAGARLVLCDKPLAVSVEEADELVALCQRAEPDQRVFIIDHYVNIALVQTMLTLARDRIGEIELIEVALLESQGILEDQIRAHAQGMSNLIHHNFAIPVKLGHNGDLYVVESVWGKHPECPVRDSFRGAVLASLRERSLTVRCTAGKYIQFPRKQISLCGNAGQMFLDRDRHQLQLTARPNWTLMADSHEDTGYRGLAQCLESGEPLATFLTLAEAREVVRLVEEAHRQAITLDEYPDGASTVFTMAAESPVKRAA